MGVVSRSVTRISRRVAPSSIGVERAHAPHSPGPGQPTPRRHAARTALPTKRATFTTCVRGQVALRLRLSAGYWFAGFIPAQSQHRTYAIGSHLRVSLAVSHTTTCRRNRTL
jgi:hypothetical protein